MSAVAELRAELLADIERYKNDPGWRGGFAPHAMPVHFARLYALLDAIETALTERDAAKDQLARFGGHVLTTLRSKSHSDIDLEISEEAWFRDAQMWKARAEELEKALAALYEWYDRDGSVGGASYVFEEHRAALSAALLHPQDQKGENINPFAPHPSDEERN